MKENSFDPAAARLDAFAGDIVMNRASDLGYPMNQKSQLLGFYKWFAGSGLNLTMVNNAGDPFDGEPHLKLNTLPFEREVIERMGPLYGFDADNLWGIVTFSGTDGNNHGIYFGSKYLEKKTRQRTARVPDDPPDRERPAMTIRQTVLIS